MKGREINFRFTAEIQRPSRHRKEEADTVRYHSRSFISVLTIFFAVLEWPSKVGWGVRPCFAWQRHLCQVQSVIRYQPGTGYLMGFSLQDPADSPTASSPSLAPAGIPQNEGVSLNSNKVSSTHLPDKLVLSKKGVVNPISPSFDPYLAESLCFLTCTMAVGLPSVQCKFLLPSILLAIAMRFSNGGNKTQGLWSLTCLELPLAFCCYCC